MSLCEWWWVLFRAKVDDLFTLTFSKKKFGKNITFKGMSEELTQASASFRSRAMFVFLYPMLSLEWGSCTYLVIAFIVYFWTEAGLCLYLYQIYIISYNNFYFDLLGPWYSWTPCEYHLLVYFIYKNGLFLRSQHYSPTNTLLSGVYGIPLTCS